MKRVQDGAPRPTAALRTWLDENLAEQESRYRRIVAAMEGLEPARAAWIRAFLARIQRLGFNVDGDLKRRVDRAELPRPRRRRHRVVF